MKRMTRPACIASALFALAACATDAGPKNEPAPPPAVPAPVAAPVAAPGPAKPDPVVVDNQDPDGRFTTQGNWHNATAGGDWGSNPCHWARPDPSGGTLARWETKLPASGRWQVFVWYGYDPYDDHATDVPYTIDHADGETAVRVNQKLNEQKWNPLGTFRFDADRPAIVTVSTDTDGNVIADAVKFVAE